MGLSLKTFAGKDADDSPLPTRTRFGIAIIVIAMLVRGAVCFSSIDHYTADPDAYTAIAETLAKTGVYGLTAASGQTIPTAFRPPLYPTVLSWLVVDGTLSKYSVAAFHTLLGCITVFCAYRASCCLLGETEHNRASILAAAAVLVDPILLQQSTLVMTETLATALASVVVWWWVRDRESSTVAWAVGLGVLLALAFLCRPTFLVWAIMMGGCVGLARPSGREQRALRLRNAAIVGVIVLLTVGGWSLRNARAIGHPVWATSHGGYTLLLGNNPSFYTYLRVGDAGTVWDAAPFLLAYSHRYDGDPRTEAFWTRHWDGAGVITVQVTEHEDDRLAYEAARATIDREPGMFLWSCVVRGFRLWSPIPHRTPDRSSMVTIAIGCYYSLLYAAIVVGLWKIGRETWQPEWWPIGTLVLTLTIVHAVYWSNIRMRAPAIPALAIVAAAAIRRPPDQTSKQTDESVS